MKQAVRGVCPRGDGHLCQGELTPQYEGCCSTKLTLPALGLRVPLWRYVHHGMPRAKCTRSESATWLVAGGTICMFCPSTWARAFPKTQQEHGYLSREAKGKGNFPTQRLLLLLKKKKSVFMPAKSLSLRIGRVFLALVRTLPLKGTDAAPAALVLQWALKLKFPSALLFGSAEHF